MMTFTKTCKICGKEFETSGSHHAQKYCNECKERVFGLLNEWTDQGYPLREKCIICGKPLLNQKRYGLKKGCCEGKCYKLLTSLYSARNTNKRVRLIRKPHGPHGPKKKKAATQVKQCKTGQLSRLGEIEAAARSAGMSYGEYMSRKYRGIV